MSNELARQRERLECERDLREQRAAAFLQDLIDLGRDLRRRSDEQAATSERHAHDLTDPKNGTSEDPNTDDAPTTDPAHLAALSPAAISLLNLIDAGLADGRRFSAAPQAKDRAAWRLVQTQIPSLTDKEAQSVIDTWLQNGMIEIRRYRDPHRRESSDGLFVNPAKRPPRTDASMR